MNNDIIKFFRGVLYEDVHDQDIILFTVYPGDEEHISNLRVVGTQYAVSRGVSGFDDSGERGKWDVLGLPARTITGMNAPVPWVLFMDWMWDFLKRKDLEPKPLENFGDTLKPYSQLTVNQKRQRKYGTSIPKDDADIGSDIKKDVVITIESLGETQEDAMLELQDLLDQETLPNWFNIIPDIENGRWFVRVQIDTQMPDQWKDRLDVLNKRKGSARNKWIDAVNELASGRTNTKQLAVLLKHMLVYKHGFNTPFHVDVIPEEELDKAVAVIKSLSLGDVVNFVKEWNKKNPKTQLAPPTISVEDKPLRGMDQIVLWGKIMNGVRSLAGKLGTDETTMLIAVGDHLISNHGFVNFDLHKMSEKDMRRAFEIVQSLKPEDVKQSLNEIEKIKEFTSDEA
jgi:hypothetical protein